MNSAGSSVILVLVKVIEHPIGMLEKGVMDLTLERADAYCFAVFT